MHLINSSHRNALIEDDAEVVFQLSDVLDGGEPVSIPVTLPNTAFDLNASSPLVPGNTSSYYFPLRKADNETQYGLGQAFLQEAYLGT